MKILFITDSTAAKGKVADVELHFSEGPLAGLKLIGFAVWERSHGKGWNVTFPARQYAVNGERRSFAMLRPSDANELASGAEAVVALSNTILAAYIAEVAAAKVQREPFANVTPPFEQRVELPPKRSKA